MELTREMLQSFAEFTPSDTAVYHVENGALITLFLSDNIPSLLSMSREEYLTITEKDAMDLTIPQDRAGLAAATLQCIRSGEPFDYYYRVFHKTRGFDWVHVQAHVCGSLEGSPLIIAQFSNLTKEGGIYQQILNTSDRLAMVLDRRSHEILYANDIAVRTSRNPAGNLLNRTCHDFLHGKNRPCDNCSMMQADRTGIVERIDYDGESGKWLEINGRNVSWCGHDAFLLYIKDVTKLKNAEFEISKAKQLYDDAAQSAKLIIWTYQPETHRAVMLNSGYTGEICRKLHVPEIIENVPESLVRYVDPGDREAFRGIYRAIADGAPGAECEFRFQFPGQITTQYERMTFRRITDENGQLKSVHCCGQNITLEKKAQEEYERVRRQLTNNLTDSVGSFELNLTRNIYIGGTVSRPEMAQAVQQETADGHLAAVAELITDREIRKKFTDMFSCAQLTRLFQNGQKEAELDYPIRTLRGGILWIHAVLHMLQNPHTGEIEGLTYCTDVTGKKREKEIIFQLSKEDCDYIGIISTVNSTYELYKGIWGSGNAAVGVPVDYGTLREQDAARYLTPEEGKAMLAATELPVLMNELQVRENYIVSYNCINPAESSCNLKKQIRFNWLNDRETEIIAIQNDVTEVYRKEQERIAELEKANREAEQASRAKTEFLSRMSHDIRTPLNGIMGMTYIAQKENNPAKTRDCLKKITTSSQFLLGLVNDVLDMSKAESGNIELHPEPYDAAEFIGYLDSVIVPLCKEKNLHLVLDVRPVTEALPLLDTLRVNQIFFNLLSNAVKFTPEGGTVTYRLREHLNGKGRLVMEAEVSDTGIGMSPEFLKVLFDPFTQERRERNPALQGTGLGLAIVKKLLDLMNCEIRVASEVGRGTSFFLKGEFDCIPADEAERQRKQAVAAAETENFRNMHVLLCEDQPINQEIAKIMLEDRGIAVRIADDGQKGVEAFAQSGSGFYDAVLMDIRMPVMDGLEAARRIRGLGRPDAQTVPIIAMTADAFADDVRKCLEAGMNGHLAKPIIPEKLSALLTEAVSGRLHG